MKKLIRITTVPISLDKLLGSQLSYMNRFFEVRIISSDTKKLSKVAEKYGVTSFAIEMTRTISPLKDLISVWKTYQFLKKEKPEIVHTHTPKAGIVGMFAAYLAGVPLRMHTVAGMPLMETTGWKRILLVAVEKGTYRFANRVYPNSFGLQKWILCHHLCSETKLKVIGNGSSNGIDTIYFNDPQVSQETRRGLEAKWGISNQDFVFVFVGRLVEDKGINELIRAFRTVSKNYSSVKLILVGPFESDLDPLEKETLHEIEMNAQIIWVGYQEDVRPFFTLGDVLVFPSYREGFPNVVMQAGAMGLPSIVTNINGCNEIIQDEHNGLIIPPKDPTALENTMERILVSKPLFEYLKSNARETIVNRFDQKAVWEALLKEYQTLAP